MTAPVAHGRQNSSPSERFSKDRTSDSEEELLAEVPGRRTKHSVDLKSKRTKSESESPLRSFANLSIQGDSKNSVRSMEDDCADTLALQKVFTNVVAKFTQLTEAQLDPIGKKIKWLRKEDLSMKELSELDKDRGYLTSFLNEEARDILTIANTIHFYCNLLRQQSGQEFNLRQTLTAMSEFPRILPVSDWCSSESVEVSQRSV